MTLSIAFDPIGVVPLAIVLICAVVFVVFGGFLRALAMPARAVLAGLIVLALLRPSLVQEERTPLSDVLAVVIDNSASMELSDRIAIQDAQLSALRSAVERADTLELAIHDMRARDDSPLYQAVERAAEQVPAGRLAGVVVLSDGQAHDVPSPEERERLAEELNAPVHLLVTGDPDQGDRRLTLERVPSFALVGEDARIEVAYHDPTGEPATVSLYRDGQRVGDARARAGQTLTLRAPMTAPGPVSIEVRVEEGPEELTLRNNRVVANFEAVRDRLRVLLVSGEPHAGERTWRDLLKADPAVDLVHFTILRPYDKFDDTPLDELALIEFPHRELFIEKIDEFDLVIFDRYKQRNVLSDIYFNNIGRYVENGGALLVAAGPAFSGIQSIYRTPLSGVLPARPIPGQVLERAFQPRVSEVGRRHPVSAALSGANAGEERPDPTWGRWWRLMSSRQVDGEAVMTDDEDRPLLLLDRFGEGRVALLLSDHAWLWARGYDGGGPTAELLRRLAHWLMGEPDLAEEALRLSAGDGTLVIERRTLEDTPPEVRVTDPDEEERIAELEEVEPGLWRGRLPARSQGIYRAASGELSALTIVGPPNPKEFEDPVATTEKLSPLSEETGGLITARHGNTAETLPDLRRVARGRPTSGNDWMGAVRTGSYRVEGVDSMPLLPWWVLMPLMFAALGLSWWLESRGR
jgi:hypothetical protein